MFIKPIEPKKFEKDKFNIKEVGNTCIFINKRLGFKVNIPLIEISSIDNKSFKPILYLLGKLEWNPNLGKEGELEYRVLRVQVFTFHITFNNAKGNI
jgi:hypothetical protein